MLPLSARSLSARSRRRRKQAQEAPHPTPTLLPAGDLPVIKVVGISGSGKSTLVHTLRAHGYHARSISQEHSNVPTLWQQFDPTHRLIYLSVSLEGQRQRRPGVGWNEAAYRTEVDRLAHARKHADLRIDTTDLTPDEVAAVALHYLRAQKVRHAEGPLEPLPPTGSATPPA